MEQIREALRLLQTEAIARFEDCADIYVNGPEPFREDTYMLRLYDPKRDVILAAKWPPAVLHSSHARTAILDELDRLELRWRQMHALFAWSGWRRGR